MQRQIYPVLLLAAVALAVAVCLRPSLAEELITLAQSWGESRPWTGTLPLLGGNRNGEAKTAGPSYEPAPVARSRHVSAASAAAGSDPIGQGRVPDPPYQGGPTSPAAPRDGWDGPLSGNPSNGSLAISPVGLSEERPGIPAAYPAIEGQAVPSRETRGSYPLPSQYPSTDRPDAPPWTWPDARQPHFDRQPSPVHAARLRGVERDPVGEAKPGPRQPRSSRVVPCENAQILARVGSDVILTCEVAAAVNEILALNKDRIPPDQWDRQRELVIRELLKQRIDFKLIYQDARRTIPAENFENIESRLAEVFETSEIPERMKRSRASSSRELEEKLQELGTSLERERRAFVERTVAQQWAQQQIDSDQEISHEQMLAYYYEHLEEFRHPARARWEQLMVHKSGHSSRAEALAAMAAMGNQVIDGAPFAEVAKARSEGVTAPGGGLRDWTTQNTLVSEMLDKAIFGLPVGALSQILEDEQGFHIVRVIERQQATVTPFLEAQVEIRRLLEKEGRQAQFRDYLARLREEIPVWTVFDAQPQQNRAPDGLDSWLR